MRRSALASATFSSWVRATDWRIQSMSAPAQKLWPFADEDDGPRLADVDERLCQLRDRGRVEGVARLGPGEDDPEDVLVPFDA